MQRKRNINFKNLLSSSSGVDKLKLHSIPINKMKNVKSNVLYSIPGVKHCATAFCDMCKLDNKTNHNSANVVRWTSPNRIPFGAVIRTRSSRKMTPYSRITGWAMASFTLLLVGLFSLIPTNKCSAASTSLTIDGSTSKSITETISPNETKYVSSNITYSANDVQDYTIKISYTNGSTGLKLDSTNSNVIIDGVVDNTTGSNIQNAWGYAWTPSTAAESDYSGLSYNAIPSDGSTKNVETGTTTNSTTKKLIFAANLSDTNPTGHYKADVLLSLIATPKATTYTLTLNNNGGTGGTTSKTCSTYTNSCEIKLSDVVAPTKSGRTFLGWADSSNATTATYTTSSTITMTGDKTIYAVWQANLFGGITTMQQMTSSICSAAAENETTRLTDSRDGKKYWVTKLKDGNCWMTQNMDYDTSSSYNPGDYYYNGRDGSHAQDATGCGTVSSLSECQALFSTSGNEHYHIGNYYTFADRNNVCPTNWRVPTSGGDRGEYGRDYEALITPYGWDKTTSEMTTKIYDAPLYFVFGGTGGSDKISGAGLSGSYLSSTVWENGGGYMAYFSFSNKIYPVSPTSTGLPLSVRCIFPVSP